MRASNAGQHNRLERTKSNHFLSTSVGQTESLGSKARGLALERPAQQRLAGFRLAAYGKLEDLLAILVYVMHSLVYRFASRRVQAAAARHVEEAASGAIHFVDEVNQADRIVFCSFQDHRARTITKDH